MKTIHRGSSRATALAVAAATLALFLVSGAGCGQKASEGQYEGAIEKSRNFVNELRELYDIPGMAVAVAIEDSIVWAQGFGYATVETKTPATPQTLFRVGSVSKVLTAGAVALLYEEGKLDLDAPVQDYVPEFSNKGYVVTTRQIAGHLSGIRHYNEDEEEDKTHYDDVISALELFKDDPLEQPPGEVYSYSSYGWNLISAVVQRASGQPFLDYMQGHVFDALDMRDTHPDDITKSIPGRATFYEGRDIAPDIDISYKWASGGFLSTVEDLARYGSAFLPGSDFLRAETKEILFTNQKTNDGTVIQHGIGWLVDRFENDESLYHHFGSMIGGQAILVIQPEDRIVVAMLANRSSGFRELAAIQIACYFLGLDDDDCPEIEGERKRRIEKQMRYELLVTAIRTWTAALERGDLTAIMAITSENFRSDRWKDKSELKQHLRQVFSSGKTEVDTENLHLRFRSRGYPIGALTHVENVRTRGAFGEAAIRLSFVREESGPMITNLEFMEP